MGNVANTYSKTPTCWKGVLSERHRICLFLASYQGIFIMGIFRYLKGGGLVLLTDNVLVKAAVRLWLWSRG